MHCNRLRTVILIAGSVLSIVAPARAVDDAPAWPQENGPFGNFNPRQYGVKLVDDPAGIKMVWVSEEHDLGMGRAGTEGFHRLKFKGVTPGTSTGLILAEGRIFASSSVPCGTVWAEHFTGIQDILKGGGKTKATAEQIEAYKLNSRIDADDFTVAIDAKTGKTVWKNVESGKGINVYPGKRSDMHNTPVYFQGRIFSLGTTGLVYCYDSVTGKKLWEDHTGSDVQVMAALKAKLLKERTGFAGGMAKAVCPVVAGGVLVLPQYSGVGDIRLRGVEATTGKTLWQTADAVCGREATPATWTHQDRQFLVTGNTAGELRMIDPINGKVLWTVTGLPPLHSALTTSAQHVFALTASKTVIGQGRHALHLVRICAYRISPDKAELAWEAPDEEPFLIWNGKDTCSMRKTLVRDGFVYGIGDYATTIFKEETGEVLLRSSPPMKQGRQCWLIEDRMMIIPNPSHRQNAHIEMWTIDPKDFHQVGSNYLPQHSRPDGGQLAAGYDVQLELPYYDGFFYMRGYRGNVICYDLRKRE